MSRRLLHDDERQGGRAPREFLRTRADDVGLRGVALFDDDVPSGTAEIALFDGAAGAVREPPL